ncbi:APC family permease [Raoultella ornithinolytica]|uniref:APC family permease n=1 Tax=Raoultella TaxID=160674 RepID=UPI00064FFD18|nr:MULTISPECIES: APC family permease [Raoultella]HDX8327932.1 APC family permease [Raoultella ornithinolytica CD1_MRS_4]ASI60028.1 amino acid transporter [Raoultella ornithinolytica]AXC29566.1 APC family permease [Raoultella sp. X13]EJD6651361.1 APC family permease [Raoultella ornithinolytica]EKR9385049.1 APC family permease [Raoultella ornithinolytica]
MKADRSSIGQETGLQRNSIGLPTVLMQSIAQIAPAVGVLTTIAFNTQQAGLSAPSAYIVAFIIGLIVAVSLAQLGKHFPSAGGFYTYVSATVGPSAGFIVGWMYSWIVALIPGGLAAYTGFVMQNEIARNYGIHIPWQAITLFILILVGTVAYRGIKTSGKMLTVLSVFEILIVAALALCGLLSPGEGGVTLAGFLPTNAPTSHGFFLAVVLSIFAFTGWEGAAAVAEEARNPRKVIPQAIVGSVILLGIFYVFCAWGIQSGWGIAHMDTLGAATENPALTVAHRLWGPAWVLVLLALLNSGIAVCIACTVDATRNWFAMARSETMPVWLKKVHPQHRTPHIAILTQTLLSLVIGLIAGSLVAPDQVFFMLATLATIIYVFVYIMGNIGVIRFFTTTMRKSLSITMHILFPIFSSAVLLCVLYYSLFPLPEPPVGYAPVAFAGLLLIGLWRLYKLKSSGQRRWEALSLYVVANEPEHTDITSSARQQSVSIKS